MSLNLPIDTTMYQALQKEADSLGIPVHELALKALQEYVNNHSRKEMLEKAITASFRDFDEAYRKLAQ